MDTARTTAPAPLEPIPFDIPVPFKTTLPNGLRVVHLQSDRIPLLSVRLAFLSGDAADPADRPGLSSAMATLMTEGTQGYSSRQLAEKIERLGASLSVSASDDFTIVSGSALSFYADDLFEMLAEVTLRPTFPDDETDLYKRNTVENLKFQRSQPGFLANEQVARLLYGDHPYSVISPTAADIERLDRAELADFHRKRIIPNNAVLVAAGNLTPDELLSKIDRFLAGWAEGTPPETRNPAVPSRSDRTLTIVDRPGSAQSNIVLANIAVKRDNPDYFPLLVMNQVLGAGASSRVFMNLREEKGYTYGAYTRLDLKQLSGEFEATAEVRTAVTGDSLKEFFFELDRIRTEPVAEQELIDAKAYLTGVFPIRAETQEGLLGLIVNQQLFDLPDDHLQAYRDNIDTVTLADVQRVANDYIHPDALAIVIVGDAAEVLPQACGFAKSVEIFDTDRNPQDLAKYEQAGELADFRGEWSLSLDFQGQTVPVTLTIEQDGSEINGKLVTMLGEGEVKGKANGTRFSATAESIMQGEGLEIAISGSLEGDSLVGSVTAAIIGEPLSFRGSRAQAA